VHTYGEYASLLNTDASEYELLLQALTINVTKFFRNPDVYESISSIVIPEVWRHAGKGVRIWSAGCSSGEETYSLAMLLHRHAIAVNELEKLPRFRVIGTDIDRPSLAAAERGTYAQSAFEETPPELRRRYFSEGWPATVAPELRSLVRFRNVDLFADDPPSPPYQLIVCRNVIIYFDRGSQETLFERFHRLLVPGGYLVLGKVETILGAARTMFNPVAARERVFRKR
jgi:chemotaxis protein methyltransferase CheR